MIYQLVYPWGPQFRTHVEPSSGKNNLNIYIYIYIYI